MSFKRSAIYTTLSAICLGTPIQSIAQGESMVLEEVIVTARKREEAIQTTPVAVTALNQDMLFQAQVVEIADLRRTAPNLSIMSGGTGSSALVFLSIRGNAQNAPNAAADAAVGTYIDGVYFARPTGGNLEMFDVRQAEILRGPQGTLFGRNTTGGAINVYTNDPTGEFDGYVKADVGNYDYYRVEGVVNAPIMGDELAARVAVRYSERGEGYGEYKGYSDPNGFVFEGLNQDGSEIDENTFARGKLLWQPADSNFSANLGGWYTKYEDTGQRTEVQGFNTAFKAGPFTLAQLAGASGFDPDNFISQQSPNDTYWNVDNTSLDNPIYNDSKGLKKPESSNENKGGMLTLDFEFGEYFLKSITAYHETESTGTVDLDGTPLNLLTFNSVWDQDQWSQEFQLSSSWGDLDWITGLYYFEEDSKGKARSRAFGAFADAGFLGPLPPGIDIEALLPVGVNTSTKNDNTSTGVFFQGNYNFTEALRVTAGLRWTWDERDIERTPETPETSSFNPDPLANCTVPEEDRDNPNKCLQTQDEDFDYPAWVVSLDYQYSDDLFLYAKTSGASMAGGWNVRGVQAPSFDPEDVVDVEVGFKADMLDGTLRLNTALFYMWAEDQQRIINEFVQETASITQYTRNAAESTIGGAEVELTWLPWQGMTITSSLAWLDSEYDNYDVDELMTSGPMAGEIVSVDHSGENAPHAPEYTVGIGATQILDSSWGEWELHGDYYWVDDTWFQDNTVFPQEGEEVQQQQRKSQEFNAIPSYGLFNAMVTLRTHDENWEFNIWGKNLADEEYYTNVSNFYTAFGAAMWYWGAPRTYGASIRYNW
jgi:iron complex outermembrane recepter protein